MKKERWILDMLDEYQRAILIIHSLMLIRKIRLRKILTIFNPINICKHVPSYIIYIIAVKSALTC
jgi:hypothetical protein